MKKIHRQWFWNGSMVAALLAAIAVFGVMLQMEKNVLTKYEKKSIYVALQEIPKGILITEENYTTYFEERQLDKSCIPQTALKSPEQVRGLVPVASIEQGVLLTEGMFEEMNTILAHMQTPVIAGFKADDLYQVVGGVLRAGDRIQIYDVREEEEMTAELVWSNVFVQQVFDSSGTAIASDDVTSAAQRINVYLDEKEVTDFYAKLTSGTLRVVKICP